MREILFRGKRVDNGEWVEGDLLHNDNCIKIREQEKNSISKSYIVIPETVGQKLFKHNVFTDDICEVYDGDDLMYYKGTISWCEDCMSYLLTDVCVNWKDEGFVKCNDLCMDGFEDGFWQFKVIGNIHDKEEK